jgi:hypothetical protein
MEDRATGFLTEALPGALAFGFGLGVGFETGGIKTKEPIILPLGLT